MTQKETKFYRVEDDYGCFSNFSAHKIWLDGFYWPTVEHYFQAQKFEDFKLREKVRAAKTPGEAAKIGRSRSNPLRSDWEEVKEKIMKKALWAKIIQHSEVRQTLVSTWGSALIEHTKNDYYWADGGDGTGKNRLGILLMEIREELMPFGIYDELKTVMLPLWLKYPEIPRGSIGWRMGYGESYFDDFLAWYNGLSDEGRKNYQKIFPEPAGWQGWYKE